MPKKQSPPKFNWGVGENDPAVEAARKRQPSEIGSTDKETAEELDLHDEQEDEEEDE